jgi:hypothetical protein
MAWAWDPQLSKRYERSPAVGMSATRIDERKTVPQAYGIPTRQGALINAYQSVSRWSPGHGANTRNDGKEMMAAKGRERTCRGMLPAPQSGSLWVFRVPPLWGGGHPPALTRIPGIHSKSMVWKRSNFNIFPKICFNPLWYQGLAPTPATTTYSGLFQKFSQYLVVFEAWRD